MIPVLQRKYIAVLAALLLMEVCGSYAQEPTDYNSYYRFPVSVGIEYQMLTPFAAYSSQFNVYQASVQARVPIPPVPFLQPTVQLGQYGRAERALEADSGYVSAEINLANVRFLGEDYEGALGGFQAALEALQQTGKGQSVTALKVLLNVSKSCYQLAKCDEAGEYYARASAIDAEKVQEYAYLSKRSGDDTARAAEERDPGRDILFIDEGE